jgi:hypothetical protein
MPVKRSIPDGGAVAVASAAPASAIKIPDASPAPARPSADRGGETVARCIALVTPPDKLNPDPRARHETDELGGRDPHFAPMMHRRLGEPSKGSPVEVAMIPDADEIYEHWDAGDFHHHIRRDLDDDGSLTGRRPHHRPWPEFIDVTGLHGLDPGDSPCDVRPHRPTSGPDTETSYLVPGEFVAAPEPGALAVLGAAFATLTLRRRRRS